MTDTVFCYHCRARHPKDKVRLVSTKVGKRWRCLKSLPPGQQEREAFGRQTTALNKAAAESKNLKPLPLYLMKERHAVLPGETVWF